MLYIQENNRQIYYSNTDSLVTSIKLPESMCDQSKLGLFKLEHEILEGYLFRW